MPFFILWQTLSILSACPDREVNLPYCICFTPWRKPRWLHHPTPPHPTPLTTHNNTNRRCLLPQWCCHLGSVCLYGQGQPFNLRVICCGGVVAPLATWSNTPHSFPDHRLKCANCFFGADWVKEAKQNRTLGIYPFLELQVSQWF